MWNVWMSDPEYIKMEKRIDAKDARAHDSRPLILIFRRLFG